MVVTKRILLYFSLFKVQRTLGELFSLLASLLHLRVRVKFRVRDRDSVRVSVRFRSGLGLTLAFG